MPCWLPVSNATAMGRMISNNSESCIAALPIVQLWEPLSTTAWPASHSRVNKADFAVAACPAMIAVIHSDE